MHIDDGFSNLINLLQAIGGLLFAVSGVSTIAVLKYPSRKNIVLLVTALTVGLTILIIGFAMKAANNERMNNDFSAQLKSQYDTVSDKSYTDLYASTDRIATFTKGDEKKQVEVIFEKNGDLKFSDISSSPYK